MATWLTGDEARVLWRDAPADDTTLDLYLEAAKIAVLAFAPDHNPVEDVPANYRLAQLMQARNTYNAGKASPGGDFDGSSFGLTTMPLDWQVKQLLRPQRGLGAIV